jgi:hypothetical protein
VRAFLDRGPTSPRLNEDALTKSQNDGSVPLMRTKCSSPSLESIVTCARCSHLGELVGGLVPVRAHFDRRWSLPTGKLCHQAGEELCVGRIEEVELSPPPSTSPSTKDPDPGRVHPPTLHRPVGGFLSLFPLTLSLCFLIEGMFCLPPDRILKTLRMGVSAMKK